jgi:hypothetical protein
MSQGPSKREIERVREALERHDSDLREEDTSERDDPGEPSEEDDERE